MTQGGINQYTCKGCGERIITIDKDEGTTPMQLACRATVGCGGSMVSSMYRVNQAMKPTHEWYKPAHKIKNPAMREHVKMGGLMIRRIQ